MAFRDEVLADSPLAYYEFDEISGTAAVDSSGSGHGGTYHGGPTLNQPSLAGKAVTFASASNQDVTYDTLGTLGANMVTSTVEFVIKTTTVATIRAIFGTVNTGTNMLMAAYLNSDRSEVAAVGTTAFSYRDATGVLLRGHITTNIYDGLEHHVVAVVTGGQGLTVYVDGVAVVVTNPGGTPMVTFANFGFPMTAAARNVRGVLDRRADITLSELAFYTTRLSAARVLAHYNALHGVAPAATRFMCLP